MAKTDAAIGPTARNGSISRRMWTGLAAMFIVSFLHFWIRTTPVRLANTDDVLFQKWTAQQTVSQQMADSALTQGRFYQATPLFTGSLAAPYLISQPWLFSLVRTIAFFAEVLLAGSLLARVSRNPALGAALVFLLLGSLHIPITYYLLLSYPFDWLGFCAVLAALHLHFSDGPPRLAARILSGACFLIACLMHEVFVCFFLLFPILSWLQGDRHWLRAQLAPVTVVVSYAAVYVLFARLHPSTYEGTQFWFSLTAIQQVVVRQLVGHLPGFELVVFRLNENSGPLLRSEAEVRATIAAMTGPDCLVALGLATAASLCLIHSLRQRAVPVLGWLGALIFAICLNLPIAVSARYQAFILCREYPYAYAFYSYFFMLAGFLGFMSWMAHGSAPRGAVRVLIGLAVAGIFATCLSAAASNHRVLEILQRRYN